MTAKAIHSFQTVLPFYGDDESNEKKDAQERQTVVANSSTTGDILETSEDERERLKKELDHLFSTAFNVMPESDWSQFVACFFKTTAERYARHVLFFRNKAGHLISATVFDYGDILFNENTYQGIHMIVTAILPEYQSFRLGHLIGKTILEQMSPDVMFSTCSQSPMLHSRIGLIKKGYVKGYEVYPRFENQKLVTVPYSDLHFAIEAFQQTYVGYCNGKQEKLDKAIRNMTILLARKEIGMTFDFHPWNKNGRVDKLAEAMGVTEKDGVLVMFVKKNLSGS